jgi:hypothetical protein
MADNNYIDIGPFPPSVHPSVKDALEKISDFLGSGKYQPFFESLYVNKLGSIPDVSYGKAGQILTTNPQGGMEWAGLFGHVKGVRFVAKQGGQFDNISAAIAAITDASASNPYLILVAPGLYAEKVVLPDGISLVGLGSSFDTQIVYSATSLVDTESTLSVLAGTGARFIGNIHFRRTNANLTGGCFRNLSEGTIYLDHCNFSCDSSIIAAVHLGTLVLTCADTHFQSCSWIGNTGWCVEVAQGTHHITHCTFPAPLPHIRVIGGVLHSSYNYFPDPDNPAVPYVLEVTAGATLNSSYDSIGGGVSGTITLAGDVDKLDGLHATSFALASDLTGYLKKDGTTPLTGNWEAGAYEITSKNLNVDGDTNAEEGAIFFNGGTTLFIKGVYE